MTDKIDLLPLPDGYDKYDPPLLYEGQMFNDRQMQDYARANVAHATASLQAEIDALRAEVERLRADLMESDEIREKLGHLLTRTAAALKGEPPEGVWHSWHDLPERAERLKEALEDIRSRLANLPTHPDDPWEFTAICRVADAALAKENNND